MRIELVENGDPIDLPLDASVATALSASTVVSAAPSLTPGWWTVGPARLVGVARVAGIDVSVRPKIPINRLFFLLGYARDGKSWLTDETTITGAPDLLTALAEAFARQAERAVSRGLLQGYRVTEDSLPVVRGRIREADQLRRRFGLSVPIEVRYDDYTVDIAENQLLRAATDRLLRLSGIPDRVRQRLRHLTRQLVDVETPVRGQLLPVWQPSRLNARYHVALRLAEIVLRGTSVEQGDGDVRIDGFMIDMPTLFEDFVTTALGVELTALGGVVHPQDPWHLDEGGRVKLEPDMVWYADDGSVRAVIDAKYKAQKPSGYPNADLYQMLAYCTALGLRRGHLIYAKGIEPAERHTVVNTGIEIVQQAVDLDANPEALLADVRSIALHIARATRCPLRV